MFQTDAIVQLENGTWSCRTQCCSVHTAEEARSGFIGPVRQISMFADLYREGKEIVLEGHRQRDSRKAGGYSESFGRRAAGKIKEE